MSISEEPLSRLSLDGYTLLIRTLLADLYTQTEMRTMVGHTHHEWLFGCTGILLMSHVCGFCAEKDPTRIARIQLRDISYLQDNNGEKWGIIQFGNSFPHMIHPVVFHGVNLLIHTRQRRRPVKNGAPRQISPESYLGPMKPRSRVDKLSNQTDYRLDLFQTYLDELSVLAGLENSVSLEDYLGVGRVMMAFSYDLDLASALLGLIRTGYPPMDQLQDPGILPRLRGKI